MNQKSAILASRSADVVNLSRKVLKEVGVADVITVSDVHEILAALAQNREACLILDYVIGVDESLTVLSAVQEAHPAGTRPVFLFSRSQDDAKAIQGIAIEFKVMQMHCGQVSRDLMRDRINKLYETQIYNKEVLDGLTAVVGARARKDTDSELKLLMNLYNRYPDDEFLAAEVADLYWRLDRLDDVLSALEPFLNAEQKNPRILNIHGRALMKKGLFEEATISLQQADLINPFNTDRLVSLGEAYLQLDSAQRAKSSFSRALELDPENMDARKGMGASLLLTGDINEALVFIRQISDPAEMASVFNASAVIAIRSGRYEEGMRLYGTAVRTIGGENDRVLAKLAFNMGLANYRIKELVLACYYFEISHLLDLQYEKAKEAATVLRRRVREAERLPIGEDLVAALLREESDEEKDDLSGEDFDLRGDSAEYDMDF